MKPDETALWEAYRADRSIANRNALVVFYIPWVRFLAKRLFAVLRASVSLEDLGSSGTIGLIECIPRYDPSHGEFTTFSAPRINGAMLSAVPSHALMPRYIDSTEIFSIEEIDQARLVDPRSINPQDATEVPERINQIRRRVSERQYACLLACANGDTGRELGERLGVSEQRGRELLSRASTLLEGLRNERILGDT